MGIRGPQPDPFSQRSMQAKNTFCDNITASNNEEAPAMPEGLPDDVAQIWNEDAPEAHRKGYLTTSSIRLFEARCRCLAEIRAIQDNPKHRRFFELRQLLKEFRAYEDSLLKARILRATIEKQAPSAASIRERFRY